MVCPSQDSDDDGVFAFEQARPAPAQTAHARSTCISSSSLDGLRQDISAEPTPDHFVAENGKQNYDRAFQMTTLTRTALRPLPTPESSRKHTKHDSGYSNSPPGLTTSSSRSSRRSENTWDNPERLLFAHHSDTSPEDVKRKLRIPTLRFPKSSQASRSIGVPVDDEEVPDAMTSSIDLEAQKPPPDLSASVMSTWNHVYEHQIAKQREQEAANEVIDELDKSFTPTVMKYETFMERVDRDAPDEADENASRSTPPTPQPERFREAWWKEGSVDGRRMEMLRGKYDSRHTHVGNGSSV